MNNTTYFVATEGKTGRDDAKRGLVWLAIEPFIPGTPLPASTAVVCDSEVLKLYDAKTRRVAVPMARWTAMLARPKPRAAKPVAGVGVFGWIRSLWLRLATV